MRDWINEHRNIFIGIIIGLSAVALLAAGMIFGKRKTQVQAKPAGNESVFATSEEETDGQSEILPSVSGETESQIESSNVTNITPSVSESETQSKSSPETQSQKAPIPDGVKSLTDGNKKVYYPAAMESLQKRYPVVVWANGTGCATETYDGLLKRIAEGGYIVVADSSVMTADGKAQIDSIDYITSQNKDADSVFYGKVDSEKIGAAGHSQGGRSSVNAAQADSRISSFLVEHDMLVYIVVFDKSAFQISEKLFADIASFIDDKYVDTHFEFNRTRSDAWGESTLLGETRILPDEDFVGMSAPCAQAVAAPKAISLKDAVNQIDESFSQMLLRKIDEKGLTDAECYKKANVDRKLFSKIRSDVHYRPSKPTTIAFAVALELSLEETKDMLMKAGFALSHSNKFDIIIEYFITHKNYNVFEINEALFAFDQSLLGA